MRSFYAVWDIAQFLNYRLRKQQFTLQPGVKNSGPDRSGFAVSANSVGNFFPLQKVA